MDQETKQTEGQAKEWGHHKGGGRRRISRSIALVAIVLSLFLLVETYGEMKTIGTIGEGIVPQDTIQVTGEGNAFAVPNIATVDFDVTSESATVPTAQTAVTTQSNAILAYLTGQGIASADVKTVNYDIEPQYQYESPGAAVNCPNGGCYPPSGNQVLVGYTVTASFEVTIRDTTKAGTILAGLGSEKVSNLSGLNFTVEDPDSVNAQARSSAITDAKSKAQVLASQLGVRLGKIVNFSESNGGPIQFESMSMSSGSAVPAAAPTPVIPVGQNKVTSNVTITYEIY